MLRRALSMLLTLGLAAGLAGVTPAAAADASPAPGFATPEDAVTAYLSGVAGADLGAILGAAAIDEMAKGFDFTAYIDRLQAWLPFTAPAPATDPFLIDLDRAQLTGQLLGQARMLIYSLLTTETLDGSTVVPVDAAWAKTFIDQLDLARLTGLEVVNVHHADTDLDTSSKYLAATAKQAAVYGADELVERVAQVRLEGHDLLVGFTLVRYGETWKVASQSSPLAGLPASGVATPVEAP